MKIEPYWMQDCVIVMPYLKKREVLKEAHQKGILIKAQLYDLETLSQHLLYRYHDLALYEIHKKFHLPYTLATILLPYLYRIENKKYQNSKLNTMVTIKNWLQEKKYLIEDTLFQKSLENKRLIFYECQYVNDIERNLLQICKEQYQVLEIQEDEKPLDTVKIVKAATMEEEVVMVAEKITTLLEQGILPSNIVLHLTTDVYRPYLQRIFKQFGIPLELKESNVLHSYDMARYCLTLLETNESLENIVAILRETYDLENRVQKEVYNQIVSILNLYIEIEDRQDLLEIVKYQMQCTHIKKWHYQNTIKQVDILKESIEASHVFLLGFMGSLFPTLYKDDQYLSDQEALLVGLSSSTDKNQLEKEKAYKCLQAIPFLEISYCLVSHKDTYSIASYISYLQKRTQVLFETYQYQYTAENYNAHLLCKNLDSYTKYGQKTEELTYLLGRTPCQYRMYQHAYQEVKPSLLHSFLQQKLTLSYSSIDTFYQCPFRYYVQYILNIKEDVKETSSIRFGNLVHKILCRVFQEEKPYLDIVEEELHEFIENQSATIRDLFYLQKYKKEIIRLIAILYKQKERTSFTETYLEQSFSLSFAGPLQVTLKGYIDKVLTFDDGENIYTIIIDYKTGMIDTNFNPVIYGMQMQLLIYLYLLKKTQPRTVFAGTYWQNVLKDILPATEGKTYQDLLEDAYRLDGYTLADLKTITKIDNTLENSFIKGLKLKKDNTFYAYSKVLSLAEMDRLLEITEENIKKAIKDIQKAAFPIKPKKIGFGTASDSCAYCPYRDICYREESDIVTVKEYKNLEFIGDENGED